MDAVAVAGAATGATRGAVPVSQSERRGLVMRLHLVRGSFVTADAARAGAAGAIMDEQVWSKLPEALLWEVVRRLPAAKLFQLHCVSRKWRAVLTSARFRNSVTTTAAATALAAAAGSRDQQHPRVVACVATTPAVACAPCTTTSSVSTMTEVCPCDEPPDSSRPPVDIDLASFVPGWFWAPESAPRWAPGTPGYCPYTVVAAAHGVVCISNNGELQHQRTHDDDDEWETWEAWKPWANRYCALNPLTRTCVVLPRVPFPPCGWLPPTATGLVTIYDDGAGGDDDDPGPGARLSPWRLATYDLAGGGGKEGWVVAPPSEYPYPDHPVYSSWTSAPAVCAGQIFWYHDGRVHVQAAPGGGGGLVEAGAAVAPPLAEAARMQALEAAASASYTGCPVFLAAHGGAVFFVTRAVAGNWRVQVPCGVWRLARDRDGVAPAAWTAVTWLEAPEVERLTRWSHAHTFEMAVVGVYGAREPLCVQLWMSSTMMGPRFSYFKTCHFVLASTWIRPTGSWFTVSPNKLLGLVGLPLVRSTPRPRVAASGPWSSGPICFSPGQLLRLPSDP